MTLHPKVRNAALAGALVAVTATAWATHEPFTRSSYVPNYFRSNPHPVVIVNDPIAVRESLTPGEAVIHTRSPPVVERSTIALPPIIIEQRRLSTDERIQLQVMDRIANAPNISGKVGVESRDAVVKLTGYTLTPAQAYRAAHEAGRVVGVKYVRNELRARVGGSV